VDKLAEALSVLGTLGTASFSVVSEAMNRRAVAGLASIIVPCWNELEFTRQCLAALIRHSRSPWELIVVDNGSTDGTDFYLNGVQDTAAVPVTVIANGENRGFPAAVNQGLQQARGEFLVLLNNDVVVTDAWLDQLIALTTATSGKQENDLTAKDAKSAKEEKKKNETGGGSGETLHALSGRPNLTVNDFEDVLSNSVADSSRTTPPPFDLAVADRSRTTPPGPPFFTRGGTRTPSSSLPTAYCALPTPSIVGPMSNYATPPQLVENVPYHDIGEMHRFAATWRDRHRGQWFNVPKLSGFCLLMKRAVYETIGGLDELFGLGFFDDDDLAQRARRAGFELAVAHDLFVHHFGSRTFAGNGVDAEKLLDENAAQFAAKWGLNGIKGRRVALKPFQDSRSTSVDSVHPPDLAERSSVSLTMIVRDEEKNLPKCLESVRGLFDEIVVIDTGSHDRTAEIARSFGARVFDFPWIDDFAAARNEALERATGDYAFWLDADDVVDPPEREKLRALLVGLGRLPGRALSAHAEASTARAEPRPPEEGLAAYVVRCACDPAPDGTGGETIVDHIRLFPLRSGVRWTYRVHEQILPSLRRAKIPVRWTDLTVRHTGYVDQALRAKKLDRDTNILKRELQERPDDPFVCFNLGAIAVERQNWEEAIGFLNKSLVSSAPSDSIVRKLYALIARAHQMMGNSQAAIQTCLEGLVLDPQDAELWFRKGVVHRHRGEPAEAEKAWRRILGLKRPNQFCSVDQGIYGHLTRRNLAVLAAERGDHAETQRLWREVLAECPGDREATAKLRGAFVREYVGAGGETMAGAGTEQDQD
jgi:glycosyltransferase involved in cell wall biosynthesis